MTPQFDVFLSHSSVDKPWVIKLKDDLIRYGVSVWLDKDEIRPGDLFAKALEDGIRNSKSVALIISPESMDSGWVRAEYYRAVNLATSGALQLIPVLYKNGEIPDFLSDRSWVDFRDDTAYAQKLWELVWGITGKKPAQLMDLTTGTKPESRKDVSTPEDRNIDLLTIEQEIKKIHVDREEEKKLFGDMIAGKSNIHILLIEADSGLGKTALLNKFWEMSDGQHRVRLDFKNAGYTFGDILGEICFQFGGDSYSMLHSQCRELLVNAGLSVAPSNLLLSSIDAALAKLESKQISIYRQMIIDALFEDLSSIYKITQRPFVMIFDTFERASNNVKDWMAKQFIVRIRRYPMIICVVSGQQTPHIDMDSDWCLQHKLERLQAKHIREYLQRVKLTQSEDIIKFITLHSEGHPITLQQLALTFSRME